MSCYKKHFVTLGLVWAGSLVLFLLAYFLVISPQSTTVSQVLQQLDETKQVYEAALLTSKPETKTRLTEELGQLQNKLGDFAVDFENSANLTFDIGRIAGEKGLSSFAIKTADGRKESRKLDHQFLQENRVKLTFEGDFIQFATFLNALERHRPVLFVDRFKIVRSLQEYAPHKVEIDVAVFVVKRQES